VDDGIYYTDPQVLECIDNGGEFDFPKLRHGKILRMPSRQFVHRSGFLFVREIRDRQGWAILVGIENGRRQRETGFSETIKRLFQEVSKQVASL
jgi:hypothetical protein